MKDKDLEKLKIYKFLTITLLIITVVSNLIGVFTNGFTVWEKFSVKKEKAPIFSLRIEPLIISYDNAYDSSINKLLFFEIETSDGIYKISDNIRIDSLEILESDYFAKNFKEPTVELKKVELDKIILDNNYPNIRGIIKVDYSFILDAEKLISMDKGEEKVIAIFNFLLPYEFNGKTYIEKRKIPLKIKK